MIRTLTDKAMLLLLFINLDGLGHPYREPPFSIICLSEKIWNVDAGVIIRGNVSIDADSSEVSSSESAGVGLGSSRGAATKAVVFWNRGLNELLEVHKGVLF